MTGHALVNDPSMLHASFNWHHCNRLKDNSFGSVFWSQAKSVVSTNSKVKEARWKTSKQLEDVFGAEAEEMKKVLPRQPT